MKPIVGITMGDPAGIGPEIILKALGDKEVYEKCRPLVIGSREVLEKVIDKFKLDLEVVLVEDPEYADYTFRRVNVIDIPLDYRCIQGKMDVGNGRAALEYIYKSIDLVEKGKVDGLATGPTNKEAMKAAGSKFSGATEIYASAAKVQDFSTLIQQGNCYIFQLTTHLPIVQAISKLTSDFIYTKIKEANRDLILLGMKNARIGVSGINPHAGDGGVLGTEEIEIFQPAIDRLREEGLDVSDPIFPMGYNGEFDALIIMYHDAANIAIKLMTKSMSTVVITGGLPFVRTTVAHGTAYDIADRGIADHRQMKKAIMTAGEIAGRKN